MAYEKFVIEYEPKSQFFGERPELDSYREARELAHSIEDYIYPAEKLEIVHLREGKEIHRESML